MVEFFESLLRGKLVRYCEIWLNLALRENFTPRLLRTPCTGYRQTRRNSDLGDYLSSEPVGNTAPRSYPSPFTRSSYTSRMWIWSIRLNLSRANTLTLHEISTSGQDNEFCLLNTKLPKRESYWPFPQNLTHCGVRLLGCRGASQEISTVTQKLQQILHTYVSTNFLQYMGDGIHWASLLLCPRKIT